MAITNWSLQIQTHPFVLNFHQKRSINHITNGFGSEITSLISEMAFEYLDAPLKRVASKDSPVAYSSILENEILVQTEWIEKAIKLTMEY